MGLRRRLRLLWRRLDNLGIPEHHGFRLWRPHSRVLIDVASMALPIPRWMAGHRGGMANWYRALIVHRRLRRPLRLVILNNSRPWYADILQWWINERSRIAVASVNEDLERADVAWVWCQDPIRDPQRVEALREWLARLPPGTPVINRLDHYNAYHEPDCFPRLRAAGVNVPRVLTTADIGHQLVVYKQRDTQPSPKTLEIYDGERDGYQAFAFVDSRDAQGHYRRYRVYYVLGALRPGAIFFSSQWQVKDNSVQARQRFHLTDAMREQVRLVATTLGLDCFVVDIIPERGTERPIITDINIFFLSGLRRRQWWRRGGWGEHHAFDLHRLQDLREADGQWFEHAFDHALARFVGRPELAVQAWSREARAARRSASSA